MTAHRLLGVRTWPGRQAEQVIWARVETTENEGMEQDVHVDGQATLRQYWNKGKEREFTIAYSFGVVGNEFGSLANPARIYRDTPPARNHKLAGATCNTLGREWAGAGLAKRRTSSAGRGCRVEKLAVGASGSRIGNQHTTGPIIRVGGKVCLT